MMNRHVKFIKDNKLTPDQLPEGIRQKAVIYEEIHDVLSEDTDLCDQAKIRDKLTRLDREILTDLLDEFSDELTYNELTEKEDLPPFQSEAEEINWHILDKLFNENTQRQFTMTELKQLGFQADFNRNPISVGNYRLVRNSVFKLKFTLSKTG